MPIPCRPGFTVPRWTFLPRRRPPRPPPGQSSFRTPVPGRFPRQACRYLCPRRLRFLHLAYPRLLPRRRLPCLRTQRQPCSLRRGPRSRWHLPCSSISPTSQKRVGACPSGTPNGVMFALSRLAFRMICRPLTPSCGTSSFRRLGCTMGVARRPAWRPGLHLPRWRIPRGPSTQARHPPRPRRPQIPRPRPRKCRCGRPSLLRSPLAPWSLLMTRWIGPWLGQGFRLHPPFATMTQRWRPRHFRRHGRLFHTPTQLLFSSQP